MKMKLSEAYLQCQDKSGRLGGVAGSVVLYVIIVVISQIPVYVERSKDESTARVCAKKEESKTD
jgi:hypothetical protein